jgi:hypothetical protein
MVQTAWSINPHLALRLAERFKNVYIEDETRSLVRRYPHQARKVPEALDYFAQPFDPAIIPSLHVCLSIAFIDHCDFSHDGLIVFPFGIPIR